MLLSLATLKIFDCVRAKDPRAQFSDTSDQPPMHSGIAFQLPPDASMMPQNTAPGAAHLSNQVVGEVERRPEQEQMDVDQQGRVLVAFMHGIKCSVAQSVQSISVLGYLPPNSLEQRLIALT